MRRKNNILHLERRASSFYWRRRLPNFFSKMASNPFLVFSLRTDVVREAEVLARRLTWLSTLAFDYARGVQNMETDLMERVLSELVRFEIAASDHARAIAPERTLVEAQLAVQREQALQDVLREALLLRNRAIAREPVRAAAGRLGVQIEEHSDDWMVLAYEATRVLLNLSMERARRDQGIFSEPSRYFHAAIANETATAPVVYHPQPMAPSTSVLPALVTTTQEPVEASKSAVAQPVAPVISQPSAPKTPKQGTIKLSEAFAKYGKVRLEGKPGKEIDEVAVPAKGESYERNSFANLQSTAKLIVDVIGDKQVSELRKRDFIEAFSIIQKVPANHGKSSTETRSIRGIVEATDLTEQKNKARVHAQLRIAGASQGNIEAAEHQENIARLRVNTVYRHMQDTQRVIRFLIAHGHLNENYMKGVIWSKRELERLEILQEDNSRKIWGDELPKLFRTSVFQGDVTDIGDPMFWAPLIAVHHGLREEELRHILMGHEMDTINLQSYGGDGHDLAYLQEVVQRVNIDVSMGNYIRKCQKVLNLRDFYYIKVPRR